MRRLHISVLSLASMIGVSTASGQSLSDFESANSRSGCESIPYPDLQSRCTASSSVVTGACKVDATSCDDLNPEELKRTVDEMRTRIEALNSEKADLQQRQGEGIRESEYEDNVERLQAIDNELEDLEVKIGEFEARFNEEQELMKSRRERAKECVDLRVEIIEIFEEAKKGATRESAPGMSSIVEELIEKWEEEEEVHKTAVSSHHEAIARCDEFLGSQL